MSTGPPQCGPGGTRGASAAALPAGRGGAALRRVMLAAVGAALLLVLTPAPAGAHGAGGIRPSNYRATVTSIQPPAPDLTATVGVGGQWVRLSHSGAGVVEVPGYQGEPFLRLAHGRVMVNANSTLAADNASLVSGGGSPNPAAPPRWQRVRPAPTVAWSDDRLTGTPGQQAMGQTATWRLPLRVDGAETTIVGTRTWVAPPSPWPWLAALTVIAAAAGAIGWLRRWRAPAVALLCGGGAASVAHVVGAGLAPQPGSAATAWATGLGFGVLCWSLVAVGIVAAARRSTHAPFAVAVAGAVLAVVSGPADLPVLWRSQLPFAWPAVIERGLIVASLGIGAGLTVAGIRRIRSTPDEAATAPGGADERARPTGGEQ